MATQLLSTGNPQTITQNTIFALPARRVLMFSQDAAPTFFQSNDVSFATSVAVTLTNGQAELAGGFLRCTSASPGPITLKALS
jgi:hypothetical protein